MSDQESFLARWSRRKRAAADPDVTAPTGEPPPDEESSPPDASPAQAEQRPSARAEDAPSEAFDSTSLPPIESITATTDIRPFLARGVPDQIRRAALRRAWTADPAIRDFIGIAENQWDFTASNGVPGFGPLLDTEDVAKLVAQIVGPATPAGSEKVESEAAPESAASPEPSENLPNTGQISSGEESAQAEADMASAAAAPSGRRRAESQDFGPGPARARRRGHGGALPT